jgi:hypothetical protein
VPWLPELFTVPVVERIRAEREREGLVPYFAGILTGELQALIDAFVGEPELHHPIRGRVRGATAFKQYMDDTISWIASADVTIDPVHVLYTPERTVEEVVLTFAGDHGDRVALPVAVATDRERDARLRELRIYYSTWPLYGRHAIRPPLLQPDPGLEEGDVVGEYQRALAAGEVEAAVAAFEPDAYVREPAGDHYMHRGTDEIRALFTHFFSNGGGIELQHCTCTDDGRACALEYNVVRWGQTELPPEAGIAVYVRGDSGKLAAARIYDDTDPPLAGS